MLIQKLRLKHGWSQQQLAEASGLSVRTIQRIEAGQPASVETLKSIAAVFEVDFSTLDPEKQSMMTTDNKLGEKQEAEAFQYVRNLRQFYQHCFRYLMVNLILVLTNFLTSPHYWWVLWVIGGWGFGLIMHAARLFGPDWMLGPDWEKRQVEKRLGRPI